VWAQIHSITELYREQPVVDQLERKIGKVKSVCGDPAYHCMCSMQVVDITPMKHRLTSITSIRVVHDDPQV
jgi:hypothetical protein